MLMKSSMKMVNNFRAIATENRPIQVEQAPH